MNKEKLVIITGASSKIAESLTLLFLKKGYKILLGYHLNLPSFIDGYSDNLNTNLFIEQVNIGDLNSIDIFFAAIKKIHPKTYPILLDNIYSVLKKTN